MESIWRKTSEIKPRPALSGKLECDTAIIGGGICGILCAMQLKARGIDAVVLEAERICSGATEGTTGKITAHHGDICSFLISKYGKAAGREYIKANLDAISEYERIIKSENIDCDFTRCRNYIYSTLSKEKIEREAQAARALGLECSVVKPPLPFFTAGAVMCENQAMFNPLKFVSAISEKLTVYEHSRVTRVEGNTLFTDGGRVKARNIIFACRMPFVNFPGLYFMRMRLERSYILTVQSNFQPEGMFIGMEKGTLSLRPYGKYLLAAGGAHTCGEEKPDSGYAAVETALGQYLPEYRVVCMQSAQDCIPAGRVPYIGRFSKIHRNWYIASGFQKWGMTSAMLASVYLSDMISGENEHINSIFAPSFPSKDRCSEISKNIGRSVCGLSRRLLFTQVKSLENGSAAHVRYRGKLYGVYRDEAGEFHSVSAACPHLGCRLEWNKNEKSWDCPCHGSRFDMDGNILSGPALRRIKTKEKDTFFLDNK